MNSRPRRSTRASPPEPSTPARSRNADDGCRRHADLVVDDVRPGRRSAAIKRIRVLAIGQPDPHRTRDPGRVARGQPHGGAWRSPAVWRPRTTSCGCSGQGQRVLLGNDAYGGTFRLIAKVWEPLGFTHGPPSTSPISTRSAPNWPERHRDDLARDPDQPAAHVLRHRGDRHDRPRAWAHSSSSTTRLRRRISSSRSRSAPTSSSTRPRSISVATATSSEASSQPSNDGAVREDSRSRRTPPGAVPAPFDCYLVLRGVKTLAVRGWTGTARTHVPSSTCSSATRRSTRSSIRSSRITPGHAAAAKQMNDFGGMVSFTVKRRAGMRRCASPTRNRDLHAGGVARRRRESDRTSLRAMTHMRRRRGSPLEVPGQPHPIVGGHRGLGRPRRRPRHRALDHV